MGDKLSKIAEESARGSLSLFLGDFSSMIIMALGSILIARLLGPGGYGLYSLTLLTPALVTSLIELGMESSVVVFLSKSKSGNSSWGMPDIIKAAFTFRIITGMLLSVVCFFSSDLIATYIFGRVELKPMIQFSSLLITFQSLFNLTYYSFIGLGMSARSSMLKALMSVVKSVLSPLLVIVGLGAFGAVIGHTTGYIVAGAIGFAWLYFKFYRVLRGRKEVNNITSLKPILNEMIKYGYPIYLSSLLLILTNQYQLLILARFSSDKSIGEFQAAVNLGSLLTVISTPIITSLLPAFSRLDVDVNIGQIREFFNKSLRYFSYLILPISIYMITMSQELISLIYGIKYKTAAYYLSLYLIIFLYSGIGRGIIDSLFNGLKKTFLTFKSYSINFIIIIITAPILTIIYGVVGLILSLLISNLSSTLYSVSLILKELSVKIDWKGQLKIYVSSVLPAFVLPMLRKLIPMTSLRIILGLLLYSTLFFTIIPVLGGIERSDFDNIKNIFGRIKLIGKLVKLIIRYEGLIMEYL